MARDHLAFAVSLLPVAATESFGLQVIKTIVFWFARMAVGLSLLFFAGSFLESQIRSCSSTASPVSAHISCVRAPLGFRMF